MFFRHLLTRDPGNVNGYAWAGSKLKYLRFITGRHDLPFYYKEEVEVQQSFLDAFLKDDDRVGWSIPGKVSPVSVILRKGDVGFNNPEAEKEYVRREESAWPIPGTQYTKFHLTPGNTLESTSPKAAGSKVLSYEALGSLEKPQLIQFSSAPFEQDTEITGHVTAHLNVSMTPDSSSTSADKEIDLFLTLRYISPSGKEVFYTGTAGDPVPLTKGWLRVSLRKIANEHPRNSPYQPYREYRSIDVQEVKPDTVYAVDVEIWPTNVVAEKGGRIVLEVSSGDTQGSGIFTHTSDVDRYVENAWLWSFADMFVGRRRSSRGRIMCISGRGWRIMLRCRLFLQDRQDRMKFFEYMTQKYLLVKNMACEDLNCIKKR